MKLELKKFKPPYFIHSDIVYAHNILVSNGKFDEKKIYVKIILIF